MAYNAVSQFDHEDNSRGPSPASPVHFPSLEQQPLTANNLGNGLHLHVAEADEDNGFSMTRSLTATPSEDDRAEFLSHPKPGLQSLQGDVERLEKTAERLSLSSADIGSEIRKMDREQGTHFNVHNALEEFSENSTTQPLSHTFLPPPPDPVPLMAFDVNRHSQYDHMNEVDRPGSAASGDTYRQANIIFNGFDGVHYVPSERKLSLTRPPLASRSEAYKQPNEGEAMVLYPAPVPAMLHLPPKLSQRPKVSEREKRRTELLANAVSPDNRKSAPWLADQDQTAGKDRRRTKHLADLPPHLRASVFFEAPSTSLDIDPAQTSAVATLDSILDASKTAPVTAFTDHPFAGPMGQEVYGSSKHGNIPKEKDVPKQRNKLRRKSALDLDHQQSLSDLRSNSPATHMYPTTEAQAAETYETTSLRRRDSETDSGSEDDSEEGSESSESDGGDEDEEVHFTGAPATLIAELEKRKHDLKQRRRTAPNAVGMHSTLLQLDAVAAKQSEQRRQKPIALAWENPDAHPNAEDDDEDVPLGILFPDKAQATDEVRPLGLMERREIEESEPLSRRRARLRGEPLPQALERRPMTMYSQQGIQGPLAQSSEHDSGDEGETLGQRLQRLKGHERNVSKAESEFTTELLAEFDHLREDENKDKQNEPPQEDETLAERRARLKKEATEKRNSGLKIPRYRRSMADILHAPRPSTAGQQSLLQEGLGPRGPIHQRSLQQFPVQPGPPKSAAGFSQHHAYSLAGPYGYPMPHPNTFYSDAILGNGNLSYAMPPAMHANAMQQAIDPGQRAVIDRWRQSIV
ncbi:hypothetical protein BDV18DRAFT_134689 [Aspergillus unguis]